MFFEGVGSLISSGTFFQTFTPSGSVEMGYIGYTSKDSECFRNEKRVPVPQVCAMIIGGRVL